MVETRPRHTCKSMHQQHTMHIPLSHLPGHHAPVALAAGWLLGAAGSGSPAGPPWPGVGAHAPGPAPPPGRPGFRLAVRHTDAQRTAGQRRRLQLRQQQRQDMPMLVSAASAWHRLNMPPISAWRAGWQAGRQACRLCALQNGPPVCGMCQELRQGDEGRNATCCCCWDVWASWAMAENRMTASPERELALLSAVMLCTMRWSTLLCAKRCDSAAAWAPAGDFSTHETGLLG